MRALPAPCYVFSDAHLGAVPLAVGHQLLDFLRHVQHDARSLVINGDLFDFWFEWRTVIPRGSFRVLAALADLRERGIEVVWIAGNHDCWGGAMLREDVGVDYQVGPWLGTLAGWRACVEHGDGLRPREDRRYRALRRVLRHPWAIRAFRWLHPDLATRVATGSSVASRTTRAKDDGVGLRQAALRRLAAEPELELLILGHSHVAALERPSGAAVYANAGNWFERPTYLRIVPERIELCAWDDLEDDRVLVSLPRATAALTER